MTAKVIRNLPPAPAPTKEYRDKGKPLTDIVNVHLEMAIQRPKNPSYRVFSKEEKREIVELWNKGVKLSAIAFQYRTTSDSIRQIIDRMNKKRTGSAATPSVQKVKGN
jgi:hypothetical protein